MVSVAFALVGQAAAHRAKAVGASHRLPWVCYDFVAADWPLTPLENAVARSTGRGRVPKAAHRAQPAAGAVSRGSHATDPRSVLGSGLVLFNLAVYAAIALATAPCVVRRLARLGHARWRRPILRAPFHLRLRQDLVAAQGRTPAAPPRRCGTCAAAGRRPARPPCAARVRTGSLMPLMCSAMPRSASSLRSCPNTSTPVASTRLIGWANRQTWRTSRMRRQVLDDGALEGAGRGEIQFVVHAQRIELRRQRRQLPQMPVAQAAVRVQAHFDDARVQPVVQEVARPISTPVSTPQ